MRYIDVSNDATRWRSKVHVYLIESFNGFSVSMNVQMIRQHSGKSCFADVLGELH